MASKNMSVIFDKCYANFLLKFAHDKNDLKPPLKFSDKTSDLHI